MGGYKDTLRKNIAPFRGLANIDKDLRQQWISRNVGRLRAARMKYNDNEYKTFAEMLYAAQLYEEVEKDNIAKGISPKARDLGIGNINRYFNSIVENADEELTFAPDTDDNGFYVGDKENTGWSPDNWQIYNSLKDDEARAEFRERVKRGQDIWEEAAARKAAEERYNTAELANMSHATISDKFSRAYEISQNSKKNPNDPLGAKRLLKDKDAIADVYNTVSNEYSEAAKNIYSKSLERFRNGEEYQNLYKNAETALDKEWKEKGIKSDSIPAEEFFTYVKENPVLAVAVGYDPETNTSKRTSMQAWNTLMEEDPGFKARYIAEERTLRALRDQGEISEDDYKQSLIDIASIALKDKESFFTRASNLGKSTTNTAVTYSLQKIAPLYNAIAMAGEDDTSVFMDTDGSIYSDSEVSLNGEYAKDSSTIAYLYKAEDGTTINAHKDKGKIYTVGDYKVVYKDDSGRIVPMNEEMLSNPELLDDPHVKRVKTVAVKDTNVGRAALSRMGKTGTGEDMEGIFNERYLSLSAKYNDWAWNRDNLDYFDKYGYSSYVNVHRPGDESADYIGESIKMLGFALPDILLSLIPSGAGNIPKIGKGIAQALTVGSGVLSAASIADSYAQGVFEENIVNNQQALEESTGKGAQEKAREWADSEEGRKNISASYNEALKAYRDAKGAPLLEEEEQQLKEQVVSQAVASKAQQYYQELKNDPKYLELQEKAIQRASDAAVVDFMGEGLKYVAINTWGFRKWMFKSSIPQIAKASEKSLFGKAFSKVGYATAEDVKNGLAKKVGDPFIKKSWKNMSRSEKAMTVGKALGSQSWGGAWTNFTDEWHSWGAKYQNDALFESDLNDEGKEGMGALMTALAAQYEGIMHANTLKSTWDAGIIGATGSLISFGPNLSGMISSLVNRKEWKGMSTTEKLSSLISNGVLNEIAQIKANDRQAAEIVDHWTKLVDSVGPAAVELIKAMDSSTRVGRSELSMENEESDVLSLMNTLRAIKAFAQSNPGLIELDYSANIKKLMEHAEKLADPSKLTDEERREYIDEIKVQNPTMTTEDAEAHLGSLSSKAELMQETLNAWEELQKSRRYREASEVGRQVMEQRLGLNLLQDYSLKNMKDRESRISGTQLLPTVETASRVEENHSTATYGKGAALNTVRNTAKLWKETLEQRKENYEKQLESLDYENKAAELKEKINSTISQTERETLTKQLADLEQDKQYYEWQIQAIDNNLENTDLQVSEIIKAFDAENPSSVKPLSAEEILALTPVARMRMLAPDNYDNYSKAQKKQIDRANDLLRKRGGTFDDVVEQALASSRYLQREEALYHVDEGDLISLSINTQVSNMLNMAKHISRVNVSEYIKSTLSTMQDNEAKRHFLKGYNAATLRYMKDKLDSKDVAIIDEILPQVETGSQIMQILWDDSKYGIQGLTEGERINLQSVIYNAFKSTDTTQEMLEKLASFAEETGNPSITTLLDKLAQVYSQQYSTVVESAKEKATREAEAKREAAERNKAAEEALKPATEAPAISKEEKPATESIEQKQSPEENKNKEEDTGKKAEEKKSEEKQESKKTDKELIQEAKDHINKAQEKVQPVEDRDPHAEHYVIDGKSYTRVHSAMGDVWIGLNSESKAANSARALKNGSLVDGIVRDFFNGVAPTKPEHFTQEAYDALITTLKAIDAKIKENGEEFLANNIVVFHEFPNGARIAGEVDIVSVKVVDGKVQYRIYDVKTSSGGKLGQVFTESPFWETTPSTQGRNTVIGTKEQYTNQLSMYQLLFNNMMGLPVSRLALLPFKLSYDADGNVTSIEKKPSIPIDYNYGVEKLVAYQPAIEECLSQIQEAYPGLFTKEQVATLKGIITNGIVKGESFAMDMVTFLDNQGLTEGFKKVGKEKLNPIIAELKEKIANINVDEALGKGEYAKETDSATATESVESSKQETPAPADIATMEKDPNEYSPEKETVQQPEVDAEFNVLGEDANSTELSQSPQATKEEEPLDGKDETTVATTIKGNAMSPYEYEDKTPGVEDQDKQDIQRGVVRYKKAGSSMQGFLDWLKSRKIDLQGLIDNKLSDILSTGTPNNPVKVFFMRVNPKMTAVGNDKMSGHYMLVVEDSPDIRKVYTQADVEKYGDFIEANGKKYLIIGTAGFANSVQGEAYRAICTTGKESVQVKSNEYFRNNPEEEFYVDGERYTHVAKMHSGYIVRQTASDSAPQVRRVSELIADKERNPLGLTLEDLVFGFQLSSEFRTVPSVDPSLYHAPRATRLGNVFMYIKGADGTYTPTLLIPTRYSEIKQGTLKQKIEEALRRLCSPEHKERYNGLLDLFNLVVLGESKTSENVDILIGTDKVPTLTFKIGNQVIYHTNVNEANFQDVVAAFTKFNPRISITKAKLSDIMSLKELDEAGALRTDIAILAKVSGDYSVYNIDSDGRPIIPDTSRETAASTVIEFGNSDVTHIRIGESYYEKDGQSYTTESGEVITETSDPVLYRSITLNEMVLNTIGAITIRRGELLYTVMPDGTVIQRDNGTHEASYVTDTGVIDSIKEEVKRSTEDYDGFIREEAAKKELNKENKKEEGPEEGKKENTSKESSSPKPEADPKTAVLDYLKEDEQKREEKKEDRKNSHSTDAPATGTSKKVNINVTEKEALLPISNTEKSTTFVEQSAMDILSSDSYWESAMTEIIRLWPEAEDMKLSQVIDLLASKGKVVTGIKDVQAWIDTLKC